MFERKAKTPVAETSRVKETQQEQTTVPRPRASVLDHLRKKRAEMIAEANWLDKEIEKLDHDITFVERHPMSAHVLEFIAARFNEEPVNAGKTPPRPAYLGG
jgi:hypothetical protein